MTHGLIHRPIAASGEVLKLTPQDAHWDYLGFCALRLKASETHSGQTADTELAMVVLTGTCRIQSSAGSWEKVGHRRSVFEGLPYVLYLPPDTDYTLSATTDLELALCSSRTRERHPACLVAPDQVGVEIRGDRNATRQIHAMLPSDFPADRLMVVEVLTPSGNWSSYPPHKHDRHDLPAEADLEEIYYYRLSKTEGFAIQKVYTGDGRLDETLTVRDGELVLIPEGYHPVVAPPGYDVYYLNALAGSARSMAASDDPDHGWVRGTWQLHDQSERLFPDVAMTRR